MRRAIPPLHATDIGGDNVVNVTCVNFVTDQSNATDSN
jgi:hypothetical protein